MVSGMLMYGKGSGECALTTELRRRWRSSRSPSVKELFVGAGSGLAENHAIALLVGDGHAVVRRAG